MLKILTHFWHVDVESFFRKGFQSSQRRLCDNLSALWSGFERANVESHFKVFFKSFWYDFQNDEKCRLN